MKSSAAVLLAVSLISSTAWCQANSTLPIYYGGLYGLLADDATDNCPKFSSLLATVGNAGGGIIQLPIGGFTKLASCNLVLPPNVIIAGSGTQGWNQGAGVAPSSGLHMTDSTHNFHIECLGTGGASPKGGLCGLENLEVLDDATNKPFMLYTCGVPYLHNVMFKGEHSAKTFDGAGHICADMGTICPDNDGIQFGAGGTGSACGTDAGTEGFNGYGANYIDQVYFQNIRTAVTLLDNANGINFKRLWGDYTDANIAGYFIYINGTTNSAYGNTFEDIDIEQAPNGSMLCNYLGAFGLDHKAQQNQISYVTSDVGNCAHGAYVLDSSSHWNDITNIGAYYSGGAVSDVNAGTYANGIYDLPNKTMYKQTYVGGKLVLNFGIDSPTSITGIPNADKFGGIIGLSNTNGNPVTNTGMPLFSDLPGGGATQFTINPAETWLGQLTVNTSTANGTAPIQIQANYGVAGTPTPQPPALNLPATQSSGSYLGNGPPLYEPAQNAFMLSTVNALPTGGTAYAIVRGLTASMIGTTQTMLGTYYSHTVPPSTTHYTGPSQQTNWTNTNQGISFVSVPFAWSVQGGLCVYTGTAQPGLGSLVVTLQKNTSTNTSLVVTVPAGGGPGVWCDNDSTHTASGSAGDWLDFKVQNNDTGTTSATIQSITLGLTPTSPATGMLVFGMGGRTLTVGQNNYFAPFGGSNWTTTSAYAQVALPRAVLVKNLHCYVAICPGTNKADFTVVKNGAAGALTISAAPLSCGAPRDISDTNSAHAMSFSQGDTIELLETQTGGTTASAASCTVEHD